MLLLAPAAAPAPAPAPEPVPSVQPALARLQSGIEVRLDAATLSVTNADGVLFEARLQARLPVTEQLEDAHPTVQVHSWNYPHLQDIAFLDLSDPAVGPFLPAIELLVADDLEFRSRLFHPHDGMGGDARRTLDYWERKLDHGYLAIVRLDGVRVQRNDATHFSCGENPTGAPLRWPLAIVRADTQGELSFRIEQASLAYDGAGTRTDPADWWQVPALCGLCQQQHPTEVELDLQDRGSSVLLRVQTRLQYPDHVGAAPEGMLIEGLPLGPWMSGGQGNEAWFVVPLDTPLADALLAVARRGDARVQVKLGTGELREAPTVRVKLDPAFEERLYATSDAPAPVEDWPQHLSASLVSAWPNPFLTSTSIEVEVPSTIEEAFDLEPELLARVQPGQEPPFGRNPMVSVKVYNVGGQLVATLDHGPRTPGRFTVSWDGQDLQSRPVASGAYYVHVEMDEWSVTRRVLLLRN